MNRLPKLSAVNIHHSFTGQLAQLLACLQPLCSPDGLEFVLSVLLCSLISVINRVSTVLSQLIGMTAE